MPFPKRINPLFRPALPLLSGLTCCLALAAGCGPQAASRGSQAAPGPAAPPAPIRRPDIAPAAAQLRQPSAPTSEEPAPTASAPSAPAAGAEPKAPRPHAPPRRSLAELLDDPGGGADALQPRLLGPGQKISIPIDDARVAVAGIRKLQSRHLTLYTDLPEQPAVDELPEVFDRAVPEWCRYFELDPQPLNDWHVTAFLIQDKPRFEAAGLIPADLPPYLHGYQQGPYLWVNNQVEDYYRRHLLLHEGTHGFMNLRLGNIGPPWYAEGMAELLGTHLWQAGQLTLAHFPQSRSETPGWGRTKIVLDDLAAGRGRMPDAILNYGPKAHLQNAAYGWCWALAAFLDGHPDYQQRFRDLRSRVRDADFNEAFRRQLASDWPDLQEQWQLFVLELDYGYDFQRSAIVRQPVQPLPPEGTTVTIQADRGWQSTGIRLQVTQQYQVVASGRYVVRRSTEDWWCEPGGVTIHYHRGQPLGLLLGAVRDETQPLTGLSPLTKPEPVGLERRWRPASGGTLYLKINESAAGLHDNRGQLTIRIEPAAA